MTPSLVPPLLPFEIKHVCLQNSCSEFDPQKKKLQTRGMGVGPKPYSFSTISHWPKRQLLCNPRFKMLLFSGLAPVCSCPSLLLSSCLILPSAPLPLHTAEEPPPTGPAWLLDAKATTLQRVQGFGYMVWDLAWLGSRDRLLVLGHRCGFPQSHFSLKISTCISVVCICLCLPVLGPAHGTGCWYWAGSKCCR